LAGWVRDCFGKNGYLPAEIFSLSYVETLMREHEQGTCDHSARLWLLLAFAAWHRQYQQGGGWKPASQTASTWEQVRIP
jgi:hypothetical protein